jgi:PAS domain-containing protein
MQASMTSAEEMLHHALAVLGQRDPQRLDEIPAALYVTDAEGVVTYYNKACIGFSGRTPEPGRDRWCVTWKLYSETGDFLPHDQCPMAVAIHEKRPVRGVTAVAERPDGSRVNFRPYPTPLLDESGELIGAVNLLDDITAGRLRGKMEQCRRLAVSLADREMARTLEGLAREYEEKLLALTAVPAR